MVEPLEGQHSHAGEVNPTLRLTTTLLNGKNYLSWARAITLSLSGKAKLGYITGTKKKPEKPEASIEEWQTNDHLVMSWLLNSMEPQISELFVFSYSSFEMWNSIQEMFGQQNNFAHIFQLKQEIAQTKQNNKTITQYLGSLKSKWDELAIYLPQTTDLKTIQERSEQEKTYQFLAGLDPSFEVVRTQILLSPKLPPLSSIVSMVQQESTWRKAMSLELYVIGEKAESQALVTNRGRGETRGNPSNRDRGRSHGNNNTSSIKCDNCKKPGHTRDHCWFLHPHLRPTKEKGERGERATHLGLADLKKEENTTLDQAGQLEQLI